MIQVFILTIGTCMFILVEDVVEMIWLRPWATLSVIISFIPSFPKLLYSIHQKCKEGTSQPNTSKGFGLKWHEGEWERPWSKKKKITKRPSLLQPRTTKGIKLILIISNNTIICTCASLVDYQKCPWRSKTHDQMSLGTILAQASSWKSGKIVETSHTEMNKHTKFSRNQCKEKWFAILHWKKKKHWIRVVLF